MDIANTQNQIQWISSLASYVEISSYICPVKLLPLEEHSSISEKLEKSPGKADQ